MDQKHSPDHDVQFTRWPEHEQAAYDLGMPYDRIVVSSRRQLKDYVRRHAGAHVRAPRAACRARPPPPDDGFAAAAPDAVLRELTRDDGFTDAERVQIEAALYDDAMHSRRRRAPSAAPARPAMDTGMGGSLQLPEIDVAQYTKRVDGHERITEQVKEIIAIVERTEAQARTQAEVLEAAHDDFDDELLSYVLHDLKGKKQRLVELAAWLESLASAVHAWCGRHAASTELLRTNGGVSEDVLQKMMQRVPPYQMVASVCMARVELIRKDLHV